MRTSREIAEELFGPVSEEGWHVRDGHALIGERFDAVVQALDQARLDGREIERAHEAGLRHLLVGHLDEIKGEREFIVRAVTQVKAAFDEMDARFTARLIEMTKTIMAKVE